MPQLKCKQCNKEFYAKPSWLKRGWGIYCSRKCGYEGRKTGKIVKCKICGKELYRNRQQLKKSKSKKYFCSKSHQIRWRNINQKGICHPNWKNGNYVNFRKILLDAKIKPICHLCGYKDIKSLVVHHKDKNRKNNNIDNLVWVCHNCHHLIHYYNEKVEK